MDKNKIIIVALIVVIIALLAGIFVSMPNFSKINSNIEIMSSDSLNEGETLQFKLTDANGTALANQTVKITFSDEDNSSSDYSVVTDGEGVGQLKLDKNAGEYNVTVSYSGNDDYNGCNVTKNLTVEKEVEVQQSTQSSSSNQDALYYDSTLNVYYNSDGIIVDPDGQHPQGAGMRYSDAVNRANQGME